MKFDNKGLEILSCAKKAININVIPNGTHVYFWSIAGKFPHFIMKNDSGELVPIKSHYLRSFGQLLSSRKAADKYGNKDCFHYQAEGNFSIGLQTIQGLKTYEKSKTYSYTIYSINGRNTGTHIHCGCGSPTNGVICDVITNDETRFSYTSRQDGVPEWTTDCELVSVKCNGSKVEVSWTATASTKSPDPKYSSLNWSNTYFDTDTIWYLGQVQHNDEDAEATYNKVVSAVDTSVPTHFLPDNFLDQLYSKLTVPNVNNLENIKDIKQIKNSLMPIINVLRRRNFKSLAEFYLWYKYQYSTSMMDLQSYYKFFLELCNKNNDSSGDMHFSLTYRSSSTTHNTRRDIVTRYNIVTDNYTAGIMQSLGIEFNLGNTWDCIPFSFVVDWFVNVGDILASIDERTVLSKLRVRTVLTSTKITEVSYPLLSIGCNDKLIVTKYKRDVSDSLPVTDLELSFKNPVGNTLTGLALIVANKRRRR